jgi:hypothetical protein
MPKKTIEEVDAWIKHKHEIARLKRSKSGRKRLHGMRCKYKKKYILPLTMEQYEKTLKFCKKNGITVADFIRRIIDAYFEMVGYTGEEEEEVEKE